MLGRVYNDIYIENVLLNHSMSDSSSNTGTGPILPEGAILWSNAYPVPIVVVIPPPGVFFVPSFIILGSVSSSSSTYCSKLSAGGYISFLGKRHSGQQGGTQKGGVLVLNTL